MKITQYPDIARTYSSGLKRKLKVSEITVHGTAGGGSALGVLKWMLSLNKKENPSDWELKRIQDYRNNIALFHFIIDYDGTIYQIIDTDRTVFHSQSGQHDHCSIGIELVNSAKDNSAQYKPEQYKALAELIEYLKQKYPITVITSHNYNAFFYSGIKRPLNCPGINFKWEHVIENMTLKVEVKEYGLKVA